MRQVDETHRSASCGNCGTQLEGRFCHACGQEDRDLNIPFSSLLAESFGDLFAFDSRLLQTLKPLLLKPGMLTVNFMAGRRARYVPPFRLYLFISILMFVLLGVSGHSFIVDQSPSDAQIVASTSLGGPEPEESGSAERWETRFEESMATLLDDPKTFDRLFNERLAQAFFVLLPIVALLLKGLYWRSKLPYLHHLIFSLHLHSFGFLLIATTVAIGMALPNDASVSIIVPFWVVAYLSLALNRVYGQGWIKIGLKTILLLAGYLVALIVATLGALVVVALA